MKRMLLFLGFLLGIVLFLIVLFSLSGDKKPSSSTDKPKPESFSIVDYSDTNSYVKYTLAGPIVGDDQYNEVRITVTPNSRNIDIIQGFQGKVINSKTYANNRNAYREFLAALGKLNFGKARKTDLVKAGSCATGRLWTYQTFNNSEIVSDVWAGNCTKGSAQGIPSRINNLFQVQITDYSDLTSDLNL